MDFRRGQLGGQYNDGFMDVWWRSCSFTGDWDYTQMQCDRVGDTLHCYEQHVANPCGPITVTNEAWLTSDGAFALHLEGLPYCTELPWIRPVPDERLVDIQGTMTFEEYVWEPYVAALPKGQTLECLLEHVMAGVVGSLDFHAGAIPRSIQSQHLLQDKIQHLV